MKQFPEFKKWQNHEINKYDYKVIEISDDDSLIWVVFIHNDNSNSIFNSDDDFSWITQLLENSSSRCGL